MISFDQLLKRELQSDFTIRLKQDRMVKCEEEKYRISKYIQTQSPALVYQTKLDALNHYSKTDGKRKKRKARIAELELRFANVEVLAPACMNSDESLPMAIVEVREITANLLPDKAPLHWLIWTSIHLKDASDSLQIVK